MRKLFLILSIGILSSSAQADGVMESLKSLISRKPKVDVCAVSYNQTNVDTAIEQVEQAMNDKKCVAKFAEYVELVLNTAAENDPGKQNYDKVGKMVTNQMKQGRIGRVHASNIVQSYFKRNIVTFSELKKVRMDTVACERNVNGDLALSSELASKAKEELRKK
ncbi:MAG: hypothetical protein KDD40_00915, partial [Bdellovibrionales bacterium]|nr:hypothetical protein [Bdellovibrionales bacterium]